MESQQNSALKDTGPGRPKIVFRDIEALLSYFLLRFWGTRGAIFGKRCPPPPGRRSSKKREKIEWRLAVILDLVTIFIITGAKIYNYQLK